MAERSSKLSLKEVRLPFRKERRPRSPSQITALDVDGQTLRLAQATIRGPRPVVTRVASAPLEFAADADRSDPAVLGAAIARTLIQLHARPSSVVLGVSRAQVVLRTLTVPVIRDLRELASIVHFQVGRDLPFRMDDAVIDFKIRREVMVAAPRAEAGAKPEGAGEGAPVPKLEVLVAAVRREVVEQYEKVAEAAGLKLAALGLLPYANARCVEACRLADGDQAFALVSLRPDEVNIDVIAQQSLLFSRGMTVRTHLGVTPSPASPAEPAPGESPVPAAPESTLAPADTFASAVTIEVVRTLHSYSGQEPHNPATKVVVAGATGFEAAVVDSLNQRLSTPCTLLDPVAGLELPSDAREHAPGAVAPIGLALGFVDPQGLPFNFLNPKRPAVQRDLRRIRILSSLAATIVLGALLWSVRSYLIQQHLKVNASVNAELAQAEKNRPAYRKMIQQAMAVDGWIKEGHDWLGHYAYLTAILPPSEEIYLTSYTVTGQGAIRLAVQAQSGEILAKLDKQLRAAGYDVKPLAITPGADRHGYEFRSTVELSVPEKMKFDLNKVKAPARPADDASLDPVVNRGGAR